MPLDDRDVAELTMLLSAERLGVLVRLTGSASAAIELHQQTLDLGTSLMGITATIEIALRNAICENLSLHFATPGWLLQPPAPFNWKAIEAANIATALDRARRAEYAKLSQAEKGKLDALAFPKGKPKNLSHRKRALDRRKSISVSDGKIIAELTLHFWKRLYGPDYDQTLWRTTLKRTFPDKKIKRAEIAEKLETVYQARNRLAHHEPVLHKRFFETMKSIHFVITRLGARTPS